MKKKWLLIAVLLISGCKGPMGSKGDTGSQGAQGNTGSPGTSPVIYIYQGAVSSDNFIVSTPQLVSNSVVVVDIGDNVDMSELPYFLPGLGINSYFLARVGQVQIYNAQSAGALYYRIQVVPYTLASSESGLDRLLP